MHLACTAYLTCMHTGDRSAEAIDAGAVLPGYEGVIVRDGYAGYGHLTDALHAWCGAHLLRDLKDLYEFEPEKQEWASQLAALLIEFRSDDKGLAIVDMMLMVDSEEIPQFRDRGLLRLQLRQFGGAIRDLEHYVKSSPNASDREEIENHLKDLRRIRASMN